MTARELEASLLNQCTVVAREVAPTAQDQREANVFQLAAVLVRSRFPRESKSLLLASEHYFAMHPSERLATGDVVRNGWLQDQSPTRAHCPTARRPSWLTSQQLGQVRKHGRVRQTSLALRVHQAGAVGFLPALRVVVDSNPAVAQAVDVDPALHLLIAACIAPIRKLQAFGEFRVGLDAVPCRTHDPAAQRRGQEVAHLLKMQVPRPARRKHDLDVWMLCQQIDQLVRPHEGRAVPVHLRAMLSHDGPRRVQYAIKIEKKDQASIPLSNPQFSIGCWPQLNVISHHVI
jgi:hypothetical protein